MAGDQGVEQKAHPKNFFSGAWEWLRSRGPKKQEKPRPQEVIELSHEEIIQARDQDLLGLEEEIATNPEARFTTLNLLSFSDGTPIRQVTVSTRAAIEARALVQDLDSHPELYRSATDPLKPLLDHGEICLLPETSGLIVRSIRAGVSGVDWDNIERRVVYQRSMSLLEEEMHKIPKEQMDSSEYKALDEKFKQVELALRAMGEPSLPRRVRTAFDPF